MTTAVETRRESELSLWRRVGSTLVLHWTDTCACLEAAAPEAPTLRRRSATSRCRRRPLGARIGASSPVSAVERGIDARSNAFPLPRDRAAGPRRDGRRLQSRRHSGAAGRHQDEVSVGSVVVLYELEVFTANDQTNAVVSVPASAVREATERGPERPRAGAGLRTVPLLATTEGKLVRIDCLLSWVQLRIE